MRTLCVGLGLALVAISPPEVYGQNAIPHWGATAGLCEDFVPSDDSAAAQCEGQCIALSAPREVAGPTAPGEAVELGLWDRSLGPRGGRALARVTAPDGTTTTATREGYGSTWISLHYPTDFPGAGRTGLGAYTVVWETRGLVICDGFAVSPRPPATGAFALERATDEAKDQELPK